MSTSEPLYKAVYHRLLEEIRLGQYNQGKRLPTEKELSDTFHVSRITAKKALNLLADEGLIVRISGKGSYLRNKISLPGSGEPQFQEKPYIALVMGGYDASFGLEIINGAMDRAEQLGYHLILKATYDDQHKEAEIVKTLIRSGVAGIMIQPVHGELYSEVILNAVYSKFPIVMIDRFLPGIEAPFAGVDNAAFSHIAANKLLDAGHREIALLAMEDEQSTSIQDRMQGFTDAFVDAGLVLKKNLWLTKIKQQALALEETPGERPLHQSCVSVIARHLSENSEITAIFGTEFYVAKAAWDAVRQLGYRVPEDISIVSFDYNTSYFGMHQLAHIRQPQYEFGTKAVDLIDDLLHHHPPEKLHMLLEGKWVDGDSLLKR